MMIPARSAAGTRSITLRGVPWMAKNVAIAGGCTSRSSSDYYIVARFCTGRNQVVPYRDDAMEISDGPV